MVKSDVAGEMVYHVWDILREFLGHILVYGIRTLKFKKTFKNSEKPLTT